jgi:hypothetical protein
LVVFRQLFIGILIGEGMLAVTLYTFNSPKEQQLKTDTGISNK